MSKIRPCISEGQINEYSVHHCGSSLPDDVAVNKLMPKEIKSDFENDLLQSANCQPE